MMEIWKERYELAIGRIREMQGESLRQEAFTPYFHRMADFALQIHEQGEWLSGEESRKAGIEEWQRRNHALYADILGDNYRTSYADPAYAVKQLGEDFGQMFSFLYAELRGMICYIHEGNMQYVTILLELLIEIYNLCQSDEENVAQSVKDAIYWFASDYCEVFLEDRIKEQILPEKDFASAVILGSDLTDLRYLYTFGEYVSENEYETAKHLLTMSDEQIRKMADVYTEGYRMGFVSTGKDLSKKRIVNIRYVLGFERVVKQAIENFAAMGLSPVIYRASVSVITKRQNLKIGYCGAAANKQYEYDHRNDQGLFLDKKYVERKLEVLRSVYEDHKEQARLFAGPACMEVFGEKPFSPEQKGACVGFSDKQKELLLSFDAKQSKVTNTYIPGEERSFTIIAYPVPEIGGDYPAIFEETVKLNTLDAALYAKVQQTLIDALDQGEAVHITGRGENRTNLTVMLHALANPEKQTNFENCVADVNIPVGEVFTSPKLEGTSGTLHVTKVYLNELEYRDLEITFENGMIADYRCGNYEHELQGREYVKENVLFGHPTLALGEFAIGTNTTAYVMARKYGIEEKLPILIAEKTGPHFAVGDTCYSYAEDIPVFNPDGKEIIARDNEVSIRRKEDPDKAYYHCHTDITIPYDELGEIAVLTSDGRKIVLIENGEFVLPGTEILNIPLKSGTI